MPTLQCIQGPGYLDHSSSVVLTRVTCPRSLFDGGGALLSLTGLNLDAAEMFPLVRYRYVHKKKTYLQTLYFFFQGNLPFTL